MSGVIRESRIAPDGIVSESITNGLGKSLFGVARSKPKGRQRPCN
jgi:hypothetical protein